MLLGMRRVLQDSHAVMDRDHSELLCGSSVLAFSFLDRSSEMWGATTNGNSGNSSTHCVKGEDVTLCNQYGEAIVPGRQTQWKYSSGRTRAARDDKSLHSVITGLASRPCGLWTRPRHAGTCGFDGNGQANVSVNISHRSVPREQSERRKYLT
ncbi:hypothetical protein JG688_00014269 [Phytophthora aleatoria]|uniref:Uncharacterized protein n=1 Tax=Phytophthora aleatoria TaxID=2496075 RepID=A0A8J5IHJ2_9STRA|nr:hypothetical protein JG688_00014269 [Phytophthora aleatoria]